MRHEAKYIVFDDGTYVVPVIFSDFEEHSEMKRRYPSNYKILGAGFISVGKFGLSCYGESVTLNVKSRGKEDEAIFLNMFGHEEVWS